ncbi:MAG TPA: glycosyltransferase [Candidatus Binatia bacterium]|nr:glycosyltransferase [Candidatus Binatia bacterium]
MERFKVLFLTNWYPTKEEPVKAVWVREQAKAVRLYDEVRVLHCAGSDSTLRQRWRGEPETDESLRESVPTYRVWYRPFPLPYASYLVYLWAICRAFRQLVDGGFRPDIIHVHVYDAGGPAVLLGKLNRIPVVVTEHFSSFPRRLLGRLDVAKAWLAFRWAHVVIPVSQALQQAIEHYGLHARFQVIPNVADTTLFSPRPHPRKALSPKRILFVGQLAPVKGVPYLLHALALLGRKRADWHLDIVGDGAARAEYERLAADLRLGEKVTFHGLQTRQGVADFMRRADLYVLSSLWENCSTSAAEALATGVPILATRCGGTEEFIGEEVGLLVPPGDADALCRGLDSMLENLRLYSCQQIARYARDRFSPELVGAQLHAVYQSLTPARPAGSASR